MGCVCSTKKAHNIVQVKPVHKIITQQMPLNFSVKNSNFSFKANKNEIDISNKYPNQDIDYLSYPKNKDIDNFDKSIYSMEHNPFAANLKTQNYNDLSEMSRLDTLENDKNERNKEEITQSLIHKFRDLQLQYNTEQKKNKTRPKFNHNLQNKPNADAEIMNSDNFFLKRQPIITPSDIEPKSNKHIPKDTKTPEIIDQRQKSNNNINNELIIPQIKHECTPPKNSNLLINLKNEIQQSLFQIFETNSKEEDMSKVISQSDENPATPILPQTVQPKNQMQSNKIYYSKNPKRQ